MIDTLNRIRNSETLARLGAGLRQAREARKVAQGKVPGMRQATVSKIENGGDVTVDTLISYANALGLDVALVPIGYRVVKPATSTLTVTPRPVDLLIEFADLKDDEEG